MLLPVLAFASHLSLVFVGQETVFDIPRVILLGDFPLDMQSSTPMHLTVSPFSPAEPSHSNPARSSLKTPIRFPATNPYPIFSSPVSPGLHLSNPSGKIPRANNSLPLYDAFILSSSPFPLHAVTAIFVFTSYHLCAG
jgi:hypothetical protein